MRSRALHAIVLGLTAAAALTLSACSGSGDDGDATATESTAQATNGADASPSSDSSASSSGTSSNSSSSSSSSGGTGGTTTTGSSRCHTADLAISFGSGGGGVSSSDDQQQLPVVLKNKSGSTCVLKGFPGVDLKGGGESWSLPRTDATPKQVTLAPGATTQFTVTYLPWTKGSGQELKATTLVVTPPNETTSATLTWPGGSVLLQDGATRPGSYTGPVGS